MRKLFAVVAAIIALTLFPSPAATAANSQPLRQFSFDWETPYSITTRQFWIRGEPSNIVVSTHMPTCYTPTNGWTTIRVKVLKRKVLKFRPDIWEQYGVTKNIYCDGAVVFSQNPNGYKYKVRQEVIPERNKCFMLYSGSTTIMYRSA